MCSIHWLLVQLWSCTTKTISNFRTFLSLLKKSVPVRSNFLWIHFKIYSVVGKALYSELIFGSNQVSSAVSSINTILFGTKTRLQHRAHPFKCWVGGILVNQKMYSTTTQIQSKGRCHVYSPVLLDTPMFKKSKNKSDVLGENFRFLNDGN